MSRRSTLSLKPRPQQPYARGRAAAVAGLSVYRNPYRRGEPAWHAWRAGWRTVGHHGIDDQRG